jgi:uncharacterized protein (TIGR02246 family)
MQKLLTLAAVATLTLLVACQEQATEQGETTEPAVDVAAEEASIRTLGDTYEQAWNAGDVDAVIALYTSDATEIAHDGTTMPASESVRATATANPGSTVSIDPDRTTVAASGDVAYETGTFTITATGPDGQPIAMTQRYLVAFKKVDDTWKADIVMSSAPLAAASAEGTTTP